MMLNLLRAFTRDESGATAIEYGLIAGIISLLIIGSLPSLGSKVNAKFSKIVTALS